MKRRSILLGLITLPVIGKSLVKESSVMPGIEYNPLGTNVECPWFIPPYYQGNIEEKLSHQKFIKKTFMDAYHLKQEND